METSNPAVWQTRPPRFPWFKVGLVLLLGAAIGLGELYWIKQRKKRTERSLPVLAQVPDFSFTTETGATLTKADLLGKIWIADFIFTRCAGPCPIMTQTMRQLQTATRLIVGGKVHLISVSVDPAYDQPEVLSKYAGKIGSNPDRWSFLTGDPATIEKFITKGMLLGLSKDGEGLPVHSQKFVLVDREGYIRAYHDLDDPGMVERMVSDIDAINREKHTPKEKLKQ